MKLVTVYAKFERLVSAIILAGMAVVILVAAYSFLRSTLEVALDFESELGYPAFQRLFDRVLAAIIAMELARSIRQMVAGQHGIQQVRTVVVIGMLAVVRKLILLEVESTSGMFLVGIAAVVVSLSLAFFVMDRIRQETFEDPLTQETGNNG